MSEYKFSKKFLQRAIILWSSFLAASAGFFIVFAFINPKSLGKVLTYPIDWSSHTGYAVGFAVLFLVALISSVFTAVLIKKRPKKKNTSKTSDKTNNP